MKTKFRPHGQKVKTNGQKLYEHCRQDTAYEIVGWEFLTQKSRDVWEKNAIGHHMFTK